jgi:hypothetical protein
VGPKDPKSGLAPQTLSVRIETPDTYGQLFDLVTRIAELLQAFNPGDWESRLVTTRIEQAPPGFFPGVKEAK